MTQPLLLNDLPPEAGTWAAELEALIELRDAHIALAPAVVVPPAVEETFYRLNNLPVRLKQVFRHVNPTDPDEDEVEEAVPEAQKLLSEHYLLDETIDLFYSALNSLPARLELRRPDETGVTVTRGRPALMALKGLWASDWELEAVMGRLERGGIGLSARPVIISPAEVTRASEAFEAQAAARLGYGLRLWVYEGAVARCGRL